MSLPKYRPWVCIVFVFYVPFACIWRRCHDTICIVFEKICRLSSDPCWNFDTKWRLRSQIRVNLLPENEGGFTISFDLSTRCEGWICNQSSSEIHGYLIRSHKLFSRYTYVYEYLQGSLSSRPEPIKLQNRASRATKYYIRSTRLSINSRII